MKYWWLLWLFMAWPATADSLEELLPRTLPSSAAWRILGATGRQDLHSVWFVDADHGWAVGDRGAIYATPDGGATWAAQASPTHGTLEDVRFLDTFRGFAVGEHGTILVTRNGGAEWEARVTPTQDRLSRILVDGNTVLVAGDNGTVLSSSDEGNSWRPGSVGDKVPCYGATLLSAGHPLLVGGKSVVYETRFGRYVSVASRLTQKRMPSGVFLSSDGGRQWTRSAVPTKDPMYAVAASGETDVVAVGGDVRLSRDWLKGKIPSYGHPVIILSRDGGLSWTQAKVPESFTGNLLDVWVWPDQTVWAVGFENQPGLPLLPIPTDGPVQPVYLYSHDGGQTWQRMDWPTLKVAEHIFFIDRRHGWAVGPKGAVEQYLPTWRVALLYNEGKYPESAAALEALGTDPETAYLRALLALRTGQLDVARAVLAEVHDAPGLYLRAVLEYRGGQLEAATGDVREATRLDPDYADAFFLRGLLTPDARLSRPYMERYLILEPDGPHAAEARH